MIPTYYLRIAKPHLKPRSRVLIHTDTHVLLIKNVIGYKQWTLPGGGRHRHETAEACARREVKEELDIKLKKLRLVGTTSEQSKGTTWNYDCFISHLKGIPPIHLSIEIAEAEWFPFSELPRSLRPYVSTLIKQIEPRQSNTK